MTQQTTHPNQTPGQNNQPDVKAGTHMSEAEKKAKADKESSHSK